VIVCARERDRRRVRVILGEERERKRERLKSVRERLKSERERERERETLSVWPMEVSSNQRSKKILHNFTPALLLRHGKVVRIREVKLLVSLATILIL